jgi:hypothetical protein
METAQRIIDRHVIMQGVGSAAWTAMARDIADALGARTNGVVTPGDRQGQGKRLGSDYLLYLVGEAWRAMASCWRFRAIAERLLVGCLRFFFSNQAFQYVPFSLVGIVLQQPAKVLDVLNADRSFHDDALLPWALRWRSAEAFPRDRNSNPRTILSRSRSRCITVAKT